MNNRSPIRTTVNRLNADNDNELLNNERILRVFQVFILAAKKTKT